MVTHKGPSAEAGHYIGWVRKDDGFVASGEGEWYKFDGELTSDTFFVLSTYQQMTKSLLSQPIRSRRWTVAARILLHTFCFTGMSSCLAFLAHLTPP